MMLTSLSRAFRSFEDAEFSEASLKLALGTILMAAYTRDHRDLASRTRPVDFELHQSLIRETPIILLTRCAFPNHFPQHPRSNILVISVSSFQRTRLFRRRLFLLLPLILFIKIIHFPLESRLPVDKMFSPARRRRGIEILEERDGGKRHSVTSGCAGWCYPR